MESFLIAFDELVLATYVAEPDKYDVVTAEYEGTITTFGDDSLPSDDTELTNHGFEIRFGFRRLANGKKAIIAFADRIAKLPELHRSRWLGLLLENVAWAEHDPQYEDWHGRYIQGSWNSTNVPLFHIVQTMKQINAITQLSVERPLYDALPETLRFPIGENTHSYQDAHRDLYRFLIDELDKDTLAALGTLLDRPVKVDSKKTLEALGTLFPELGEGSAFAQAMEPISANRRLAAHKKRPKAIAFPAHSSFIEDLERCNPALKELLKLLAVATGLDPDAAMRRLEQLRYFPKIDRPPHGHFSIVQALKMIEKTISNVRVGFAERVPGVHESEVIIMDFTDGSTVGIETGSNAQNISRDSEDPARAIMPDDFSVDFIVKWIDPLKQLENDGI